MMKYFLHTLFCLVLIPALAHADWPRACPTSGCTERLVTSPEDGLDGSLRKVLQTACENAGDDAIQFGFSNIIELESPLAIPESCNGSVHLFGRSDSRTKISGEEISSGFANGDNCMIRVDGNRHTISRLNLIRYSNSNVETRKMAQGIALCLVGSGNRVTDSTFGVVDQGNLSASNDVGILILGDSNTVSESHFSQNKLDGIQIRGSANALFGNYFGFPLENCEFGKEVSQALSPEESATHGASSNPSAATVPAPVGGCQLMPDTTTQSLSTCSKVSNWRHGIYLTENAFHNTIGGTQKSRQNLFQYQGVSGIRLDGTSANRGNLLSPNIFNRNSSMAIDLGEEGPTPNDTGDTDSGPNTLLNRPELMVIHVRNTFGPAENRRFFLYGKAGKGRFVDIYLADNNDTNGYSEGLTFLSRETITGDDALFSIPLPVSVNIGSLITAVAVDEDNNTSEFAFTLSTDIDSDLDGIPDRVEDINQNGVVDALESDPYRADTDADGLMDALEDLNRNGRQELSETATFAADTDEDALTDFIETHGDGIFEAGNGDTDPLKPDTDCDGILDGDEDANHNGLVEWHLNETFPQIADSDGDGVSDGPLQRCVLAVPADNCVLVPNVGQQDADGDSFGDVCDAS
ncbi:MAG: right-handed parallel beta-helix repeat-containing protein [Deltaproteobacteria bacterium]|nr:right-handed parallel beta-helix repeat-containing protein [Deltaproteobacteria bacterium]